MYVERRTTPRSGSPAREVRSDREGGAYRSAGARRPGSGHVRCGGPGPSEGSVWTGQGPWRALWPRRGRSRDKCTCRAILAGGGAFRRSDDRWSRPESCWLEGRGGSGAADSPEARTARPHSPRGRPRRGWPRERWFGSDRSWLGSVVRPHLQDRGSFFPPGLSMDSHAAVRRPLCSDPVGKRTGAGRQRRYVHPNLFNMKRGRRICV